MNITKVLVAIDESENSDRALDFALGISEKFEAAITILNVSESLAINPNAAETMTSSSASMAEVAKDINKIHENFLSKAVAKAKELSPTAGSLVEWLDRIPPWDATDDVARYVSILSKVVERIRGLMERNT